MADASRFPSLALPFAITGSAAGWLSAGLLQQPLRYVPNGRFRVLAALIGLTLGALTGALLRRYCVGKRYTWQLDAPDPEARPSSDTWGAHAFTILAAGAIAGALVMGLWGEADRAALSALVGLACTIPFLPICAAVLSAARRAQRGRLGSLVASADRRAVWGILAITLLFASLEGVVDWITPRSDWSGPEPLLALLAALFLTLAAVTIADFRAYRRARLAITTSLVRHEEDDRAVEVEAAPRLDLGLGNEVHAQLQRGVAAYRGRDRALALVQGDPERALAALRGALRRDVSGLGAMLALGLVHTAAQGAYAARVYQEIRCEAGVLESCADAVSGAVAEGDIDRMTALRMYLQRCDRGDGRSCMSIANLYRGGEGSVGDGGVVAFFEYRAAQRGICRDGEKIVNRGEPFCIPEDGSAVSP